MTFSPSHYIKIIVNGSILTLFFQIVALTSSMTFSPLTIISVSTCMGTFILPLYYNIVASSRFGSIQQYLDDIRIPILNQALLKSYLTFIMLGFALYVAYYVSGSLAFIGPSIILIISLVPQILLISQLAPLLK